MALSRRPRRNINQGTTDPETSNNCVQDPSDPTIRSPILINSLALGDPGAEGEKDKKNVDSAKTDD